MSDAYYQEQAARRTRRLWVLGAIAAAVVIVFLVVRALFYDACTQGFDRSPTAVISTYVEAVRQGNAPVAQECWEHEAFYDLEAGCSEICLSRVFGTQYQVIDITLGEPSITSEGRTTLEATVSVACSEGGESHTGRVLLDSVGGNVPWKHWAIVHSTFGGTVAGPWCE